MSRTQEFVFEPLSYSSLLLIITIGITFPVQFLLPGISYFGIVSNLLLLEFGSLLILGGCLMARQPLEDENRYDESGEPVTSWRWALRGRMLLIMSIFTFLYTVLFGVLSTALVLS